MKRRRGFSKHGNALLEFALSLAVLIPVVAGAFQFSVAFLARQQLETAVHTGARYGSELSYDSHDASPGAEFRRAVENVVLYGRAEEGAHPQVAGLSRENVNVEVRMEAGVPREVTVSISGFRLDLPGGAQVLEKSPRSTFPYRGHFSHSLAGRF